ncbi:restriction endonuclease subunit S [Streptococcus suis]|nr:restriction endonuclease subunit S [Streptococcus suis]
MPNKDKNIPKRRFKAFENADAWELRKIFEIADRFDNLRVPIASSLRVSGSTPYYGANGIQDYVEGYTHEGEFILVAEDGANDLKNYPVNLVNGKIWVNNHAHVLQGKNSIADNKFLAFSINQTNIESLLVGGGRAKLNSDVLMNIELKLPSPAEQEAIGTFFSTLDQQITLHQRKLDKLKSVKQAYLSEMFPAEGECVPKRRFPGFTDDWELRKLGEVARFRRGSFPQPYGNSEWYDGDGAMPFVQVADVTDEMNLVEDTKQKISKKAQPLSVYAEKGSVLVTLQGSIGRVAITQYGAFIDRTVLIFENFYLPIDNLFWAYVIKQKFIEEAKSAPGGTIKTITKEVLSDFNIKLPTHAEQEAIGTFFSTLDRHITLHQRKLEKLKNLKKALLNELFVWFSA